MDLIDRSKLHSVYTIDGIDSEGVITTRSYWASDVANAPTIEAIPVEWIKKFVNERAANDGPDGWWHCWGEDVLLMIAQWEKENE